MTVLRELAERGHRVGAGLSPPAAAATATLVLDTVGCAVAGRGHPLAIEFIRTAQAFSGSASPALRDRVALTATLAHLDELDAFHTAAAVLPCATVVPVALELARHRATAGPVLLAAVAAGAEVIVEAGLRFNASALYARGWWPAALFGGLGAAMTASLLLGHDEATTAQALGLAAAGLGGLLSADQLAAGHYRLVGRAAADGLEAALGAECGQRAGATLLDHPAAAALGRPANPPSPTQEPHLAAGAIKMFACARPLHAAIEALAELRARGHDPARADRIRISLPAPTLRFVTAERDPAGPAEAAASAAYVLTAFRADRADDPTYFRATGPIDAPDVELADDPELDARYPFHWGARVELFGRDPAEACVLDARGGPERPWPQAQIHEKFRRLVAPYWPRPVAEEWLRQCTDLAQTLGSVSPWAGRIPLVASMAG